jgi:hypothetical protein
VEGKKGRMAFLVEGRERRKEAASRARKFDTGSLETRRFIFTSLSDLFLGGALTGTAKAGGVISHILGGVVVVHSVAASLAFCLGWSLAR